MSGLRHHTALDVDPRSLTLAKNVRTDPVADAALVASIRQHGVLQPIVCEEPEPERFVVLAGHRRTLAAIEAGLAMVPITVVTNRLEHERVLAQLAENDHRTALTDVDHAQAYEQLALIGMSAADIAAATSTPAERVTAGLAVAKSPKALEVAASSPTVPLDHLAAIAEFDGDPDAVEELTRWAGTAQWAHRLASQQTARQERQAVAALLDELEAAGEPVLREKPVLSWDGTSPAARLDDLTGAGPKSHVKCPGRAIVVEVLWRWRNGGEKRVLEADAVEICTDWRTHGHVHKRVKAKAADLPDPEREAKAAERRQTIARNKAWPIATEVRRAWIADLFAGTPGRDPKVLLWIAKQLVEDLVSDSGSELVEAWVGVKTGYRGRGAKSGKSVAATNAQHVMHAIAIASREANLGSKEGWRTWAGGHSDDVRIDYLKHLETLGYTLAPVERLAAGYELAEGEEL